MAEPTPVNSQITDAVTQSDLTVAGDAPAVALATIYQNLAHATVLAMQNAVQQQQNTWTVQMAVTAKVVKQILSDDPVSPIGDPLYDFFDDIDDFEGLEDEDEETF